MPGIDAPHPQRAPTNPPGPPSIRAADAPSDAAARRPFDGLRILDLGVIVAGGELGRLFADLGAEVIKIESAAYPTDCARRRPASR